MSILFDGVYQNLTTPWWATDITNPANIEASTITINAEPAGNITLTNVISSGTEFNAPLIFQRPPLDPNAPSESLVMNLSDDVPTKPSNGSYITATKALGTAYDDIAVAGLQVYGDQTTSANSGAHAYITGDGGNLVLAPKNSVMISSLQVSTLSVINVISTTATTGNSFTATLFMSTPILNTDAISSSQISTNAIKAVTGNFSTINVSTLNAPNFTASTLSTIVIDTKVTLTSTLSLLGNPTNINLGLGDVIQGLVGGAATQAIGAGLGGAGLITGIAAIATGRTSGGVNSNVFQTVNGSTQLQFSTLGSAVSSVFLTVNSPNPLTTPGLEIQQSQGVAAGTYCVRSVGDPLYITNNVSSIQMVGQWVPVIQPTATIPAVAVSSLGVSSINGATYPPPGGGGIPSTLAASSITVNGSLTQSGTGTFNWGGNTMSPTQVVLARPTSVNATLTTTGAAFLNAGATVNNGLTVASGGATISGGGNLSVTGNAFVTGVLQGGTVQAGSGVTVSGGIFVNTGGIQINSGNFNMTGGASVANITNVNVSQNLIANQLVRTSAISTTNISTNNINLFTINNQSYPPPSGPTSIPSTLNASTITFNGGLTNIGSDPITTNTINTTNANVNFYVGNAINAASISTTTISTNTIFAGTITTNTMNTTTTNANNIQAAAMSTNILSTNMIRAAAISSFMISSANGIITNLNVSSVNGAAYPPGGGGSGILSTLNASTINVNGGINIANGGIINNSFDPIRTGFLSTNFLSTGLISVDTLRADFLSTNTIRAAGLSTLFVSSGTITASNMGCFQFSSLTGSINTFTSFTISTINLSTNVLAAGGVSTNTISTNSLTAASISTNALVALNGNVSSLTISSINSLPYPPPVSVLPTGGIMIWGGTNGSAPLGWLTCDGSLVAKSTYQNLFNVIGNSYYNGRNTGVPFDSNFFFLPDFTFAIPQGAVTTSYQIKALVQTFDYSVSGFPAPVSSNSYWSLGFGQTSGTINIGTYFPPGSVPGAAAGIGYRISRVLKLGLNDQPFVVEVTADNNSAVPYISTAIVLSTIGVYRGNGTSPIKYWVPGTFNQSYQGGSNITPLVQPISNTFAILDATNIPAHVHNGTPSIESTALAGASLLAGASGNPGGATSVQTSATSIGSISGTSNYPAPYATVPNVINMFYIIKT